MDGIRGDGEARDNVSNVSGVAGNEPLAMEPHARATDANSRPCDRSSRGKFSRADERGFSAKTNTRRQGAGAAYASVCDSILCAGVPAAVSEIPFTSLPNTSHPLRGRRQNISKYGPSRRSAMW